VVSKWAILPRNILNYYIQSKSATSKQLFGNFQFRVFLGFIRRSRCRIHKSSEQILLMSLVLVTGATGRLGSLVASALLERGDEVRAIVRPQSTGKLPRAAERIEHDLGSAALPASAFAGVQKVAHLAGLVGEHPYSQLVLANAFATKHALANCPPEVEKVVLASSISIYGEYKGQVVDETFEPRCESPYGKSKLLAETFAREYGGSLPIVFLRFGMIYGPAFEDGYFQILDRLSAGKMRVLGSGENRLPLLHQSDAALATLLALDSGAVSSHCREYNVVGREKLSQKELLNLASAQLKVAPPAGSVPVIAVRASVFAKRFLSALHLAAPPSFSEENIRQLTLDRAYSCDRADAELGFKPKVKLSDGLKETVGAYLAKRHPQV